MWIQGDSPPVPTIQNFVISPKITIYVGCNSQSYSPKFIDIYIQEIHHWVGQPQSEVSFILTKITMDQPNIGCGLQNYELQIDESSDKAGIKQKSENCFDKQSCRTAILKTDKEYNHTITWKVTSNADSPFDIMITPNYIIKVSCGQETQSVTQAQLMYVLSANEENNIIDFQIDNIREMFFSDIQACDVSRFQMFRSPSSNPLQVWTDDNIKLLESNKTTDTQIEIKTDSNNGFRHQILIYSFVKDKIADQGLLIDITVCGQERFVTTISPFQSFHLIQTESDAPVVLFDNSDITKMFIYFNGESNSLCNNEAIGLYRDAELTIPYDEGAQFVGEEIVELYQELKENGTFIREIIIHTNNLLDSIVIYLGRISKGQQKAFIALDLSVLPFEEDIKTQEIVNQPPRFISYPNQVWQFQIQEEAKPGEEEKNIIYDLILPKIEDDKQNLSEVVIKSKSFGDVKWTNSSQEVNASPEQILTYKFLDRMLVFEFQNHTTLSKYNGSHSLVITLIDSQQKDKKYALSIIFKIKPKQVIYDDQKQTTKEGKAPLISSVTAKISNLNKFGELTIEFSHDMNTSLDFYDITSKNSNFDFKTFKFGPIIGKLGSLRRDLLVAQFVANYFSNLINVHVEPYENWNLYNNDFEMKFLNLTWEVKNFSGRILEIQITFDEPSYISPMNVQDTIVVWINEDKTFFQQADPPHQYLNRNSTIMRHKIVKQIRDSIQQRNLDKASETTQVSLMWILAVQVLLNTIFAGSMIYMVSMINSLQFIFHLPIMNVIFPANVMSYFSIMMPLVMFDVLSDIPSLQEYFQDNSQGADILNIRDQMQDLGYDSHNPFVILKTLLALQVIYTIRLFLLFAVLYPFKKFCFGGCKRKSSRCYKSLKKQLIFTEILAIFFGSFIELLIAGVLYQNTPEENPNRTLFSNMFSLYFMSIPIIIIPGLFFWMFTKSLREIKAPQFQKRWSLLTDNMSLKNPIQVTYYLVFCLRRVYFVGLAFILNKAPVLQIIGLNLINLFMIVYTASILPFKSRFHNYLEILNNFSMTNISLMMMLFTDWVNPPAQIMYANLMVTIISCIVGVNLVIIVWKSWLNLKLIIIKYYRIFTLWWKVTRVKLFKAYVEVKDAIWSFGVYTHMFIDVQNSQIDSEKVKIGFRIKKSSVKFKKRSSSYNKETKEKKKEKKSQPNQFCIQPKQQQENKILDQKQNQQQRLNYKNHYEDYLDDQTQINLFKKPEQNPDFPHQQKKIQNPSNSAMVDEKLVFKYHDILNSRRINFDDKEQKITEVRNNLQQFKSNTAYQRDANYEFQYHAMLRPRSLEERQQELAQGKQLTYQQVMDYYDEIEQYKMRAKSRGLTVIN